MQFLKIVKVGEILRNRRNRKIWLIVGKSTKGVYVIDLMIQHNGPAPINIILQDQSDEWDRDTDIEDLEEWEKNMMMQNMTLIDSIEVHAEQQERTQMNPDSIHVKKLKLSHINGII